MAFGGTIKLKGESEYRSALRGINQSLREVNSAMKVVTTEFGKNDTSITALTRKQDVLKQKLEQQREKLNLVSQQYKKYEQAVKQSANEHTQLGAKLESAKNKLEQIKSTLGESSSAYQKQKQVVDQLQKEYDKSTEAQDKNKQSLSKLAVQMNNAQADVNKTAHQVDDLGDQMREAENPTKELGKSVEDAGDKAEKAGHGGFTVFKGIVANLASTAITSAINGLRELGGALVGVGKQALESYSDYEQLTGGVDTLFKKSSQTVQDYASNAYKTAGMSANEYMDTVTSFSASLISSLHGNTAKAANVANMAITDMADNANKMGTSMEDIQHAYQGFAKQNYGMLDNLKLGYGGTKSEMERLIADANKVKKANGEMGNLSIHSFADVAEAIHIMQQKMGIAGTTAKEASTTIEGSVNSMKSAWQNLLVGVADGHADFGKLVQNFVNATLTAAQNVGPRIVQILSGVGQLVSGLVTKFVPVIMEKVPPLITKAIPNILSAVNSIVSALGQVLPKIISWVTKIMPQVVQTLLGAIPALISVGTQIVETLANGLSSGLPKLISKLPEIIEKIVTSLGSNLPKIVDSGLKIITALVQGLTSALPQLISKAPTMIASLVQGIVQSLPSIVIQGTKIILALVKGLVQSIPALVVAVVQTVGKILSTLATNLPKVGLEIVQAAGKWIASLGPQLAKFPQMFSQFLGQVISRVVSWASNLVAKGVSAGSRFIQGVVNFVRQLPSKIATFLTVAITRVAQWTKLMVAKARYVGSKFLSNVVQFFRQLPSKIASFLRSVISRVTSWASNMASKASSAGSRFLSGVVRFVSQLPGRIAGFLANVVSRVTSWAGQMASRAVSAGSRFLSGVVRFVSQLPGRIAGFLASVISRLAAWAGQMASAGARGAQSMFNSVVNGLRGLPSAVASIGSNIVHGIWNGITGAAGWLYSQVASFAQNIVNTVKSHLKIHSPSRVMRDEVGVNIARGVVAGVKKEQKNTVRDLNKTTDETLRKWYKKRNELQSEYERSHNAKSRANIRKRIASVNDSIVEAEKKGNAKVSALRAKHDNALLRSARSRASELSKAGKLSVSAEISYWEKIAKSCHKGTSAYNSAIAKVAQAKRTLNTDISKLTKTYDSGIEKASKDLDKKISELKKTYSDAVTKRRDEIADSLDLFSGVKLDKWFDKDELTENLQDQVDNLKSWNDTLDSLEKRLGAKNPLYQELTKMGVSQIDTLKQINSMSNEELKHYNDLYSQKRAIAMQRATEENAGLKAQTDKAIANAKASTNKQINKLQGTYMTGLKKLGIRLNKQGLNVGRNIISGLNLGVTKGISSIIPKVEKQVGKLVKAIKKKLKIHSPSQVMRDEVGKYMAQGIGVGFEQEMQAVSQQMNDSLPTSFNVQNPTVGATENGLTDSLTMLDLVDSFKQALSEMKIELDDEVAGKFVNRTVAKAIYR